MGSRVMGLGFRVQGSWGLGFMGFRVMGLGFWGYGVWGLAFRVQHLGFAV